MTQNTALLQEYYVQIEELYRLRCIAGLLGWDQQVCMPPKAAQARAEQQETLGKIIHQKSTDAKFARCVDALFEAQQQLGPDDLVNIRESKRALDRARKLSDDFVAEQTRICSLTYVEWTKARPANDFGAVRPHLEKVYELAVKEAELVGFDEHPYDALLDSYEPHAKLSQVKPLLGRLGERLSKMIGPIRQTLSAELPKLSSAEESKQYQLCHRVARDFGYDFEAGKLDKTHHPFESSVGPFDVRITTRYSAENWLSSIFTTMHETGHALYEQGLSKQYRGAPLGSPVSLGIHESQSRLWENLIGRGKPFAYYLHSLLKGHLPEEHSRLNPDQIWQLTNAVRPSLIRVEADEVTYSLHVVIRMLLEEQLVSGALKVAELPEAWNAMYQKYLGLKPESDQNGVLQDVHWYGGMIGYFPTYALGNLYGAMMMECIRESLPTLDRQVERGDFSALLAWLRSNVHEHGMRYTGSDLIAHIAGAPLSEEPFLRYLAAKFDLSSY